MIRTTENARNSGRAALLSVVVIAVVVIIVLGLALLALYIPGYNRAIRLDQATNQAWADVDAQLQRRLDLIPNLVATVQGYATHEKEIFENIAQARTKYFRADNIVGKIEASHELTGLLSRLLVLQEVLRLPPCFSARGLLTWQPGSRHNECHDKWKRQNAG